LFHSYILGRLSRQFFTFLSTGGKFDWIARH
jgi:hypothetical protein